MRLTVKLVVWFIGCVVLAVGLNGYFAVRGELERFEAGLEAHHVFMGRVLREAFSEVMDTDGEGRAVSMLKYTDQRVHVDIRWVSLEADGNPERQAASDLNGRRLLESLRANREVHVKEDGKLQSYIPMHLEGRPLSALELSENLDGESVVIRHSILHEVRVVLGVVFGIGVAAVILGALLIARPIRQLIEHARRVGRGDLSLMSAPNGRDEIAQLAREMNTMTAQLSEAQLAKMKALEQLRHAERLSTVGKLASGLAHELGTPLNVITLRAKSIARGRATGDTARDAGTAIAEQATRMTNLVRQLLDFARRKSPQRGRVDVLHLLQRTSTLVETIAAKAKVRIQISNTDDDDDGDSALYYVRGDATQLEQVLTNLLINAIQAMSTIQGGSVFMTTSLEHNVDPPADLRQEGGGRLDLDNNGYIAIGVRDEGIGIDEETLNHIFEPFFTTKPVGEGTGLGLAVCYGIVRDHGGFIHVSSEVGNGSTVTVYLPKEADEA